MKNLFACLAVLAAFNAGAQSIPYNPDADNDGVIGASDIIASLAIYGNSWGVDTSLSCDYQGTELEDLMAGIFDATIILDSVYIEYLLIDSSSIFVPGCPEPAVVETIFERAFYITMPPISSHGFFNMTRGSANFLGYARDLWFSFSPDQGWYGWGMEDNEIYHLTNWSSQEETYTYIPFGPEYFLDSDGIHVDWEGYFPEHCEHFRLIPYWHYAE